MAFKNARAMVFLKSGRRATTTKLKRVFKKRVNNVGCDPILHEDFGWVTIQTECVEVFYVYQVRIIWVSECIVWLGPTSFYVIVLLSPTGSTIVTVTQPTLLPAPLLPPRWATELLVLVYNRLPSHYYCQQFYCSILRITPY